MQKIVLYIQPQQTRVSTIEEDFVRLDLMEEDLISLTQVIQDVKDIEKLFTDYSRTFNLPASKTNNKIFKHWYNPDIQGFNNQLFSASKIELNHFEFKTGKIQLNEVVMRHGEPSMYKVTFFGDTIEFKNAINEDLISDLSWLNNFNHELNTTNVKNGLENGINFTFDSVTYNDAVIYPLIAHSQSYIYNLNGDHQNPVNISTNSSDQKKRGVLPEDLKPAIKVNHIIQAIQNQYNINFKTGEFLDSAVFDNMYMWLHREKGAMKLDKGKIIDDIAFTCSGTDCTAMTDPNYDYNFLLRGWFELSTGIFHFQPELGTDFEETVYTATITPNSPFLGVPYTVEIIRLNDMQVFARQERVLGASTISITMFTDPNSPNSATGNKLNRVDLWYFGNNETGSNVTAPSRFVVRVISENDVFFTASYAIDRTYTNTSAAGVVTTETLNGVFNSTVSMSSVDKFVVITEQVPKLKIKDFLNGLFRQYNLTAYLDYNGKIVVETLDSYYAAGETHDITEFVETDRHRIGETIPFSEVYFEYSEPKSILAQQFQLLNNQKYGELNYIANVSKKNTYRIRLPFESMIYERLFDQGNGASTSIQIGTFLNEDLQPDLGKPLMFYGIHQDSEESTGINFVDSTRADLSTGGHSNYTLSNYWIPSAYNELGTSSTPPAYNLNFGSEINTYTLTDYSGTNNSLFQLYYENYITRVFNTRTRIFKFSAILPLKVLLNLTLNDLIVIGTRSYTINKMTTKLQSGETNLELLNEPS